MKKKRRRHKGMVMQRHHITYNPERIVKIGLQMHECVSRIQHSHSTLERLEIVLNFWDALTFEIQRMMLELIIEEDMRILRPKFLRRKPPKRFTRQRSPILRARLNL